MTDAAASISGAYDSMIGYLEEALGVREDLLMADVEKELTAPTRVLTKPVPSLRWFYPDAPDLAQLKKRGIVRREAAQPRFWRQLQSVIFVD